MKNFKNLIILTSFFLVFSCNYDFPEPVVDTDNIIQNADISNVVLIGGSMMAGLEDGAISLRSTQYSMASIFAQSLNSELDLTTFAPYFNSTNGFNIYENPTLADNVGSYRLFYPSSFALDFIRDTRSGEPLVYDNAESNSIKAFAFPEAQILDFTEPGRNRSKYVSSFYGDASQTIIEKAVAQNPSFFVLELGMEDILGSALGGAEGNANSNDLANSIYANILDESLFAQKLQEVTNALLNQNSEAKGVLVNIPNFLDFPYFVQNLADIQPSLRQEPLILSRARTAAFSYNQKLTTYYNQNPGIPFDQRRPILDFAGDLSNWGIIIEDNDLPDIVVDGETLPKVRHAALDELIFFTSDASYGTEFGALPTTAVSESRALKLSEIELIKNKIDAYNTIIENAVAQSNGRLISVDLHSFFEQLMQGFDRLLGNPPEGTLVDGVLFSPTIDKFGIFSADGLNFNPAGKSLIVNQIIKAINEGYDGQLRLVDANQFPSTSFEVD